jgi:electron-transferring-flavoprotein dehydrogenase
VQLADQGTDKAGNPDLASFMPGMNIKAALTVVGDGPVGPVSRQLDDKFGLPAGHYKRDWALGMKIVVDLPEGCPLEAGTVLHTFGYPEPEIFGFMYVHPGKIASLGIFVPSWFDSPTRTAYRYLQHWMMHPYIYQYIEGGTMRSWGAKSLEEAGQRGEPYLVGNGYARIGENSGSTNLLTNSGVDEAWMTGIQLAEAVIELARDKKPFSKENLENTYVKRRRESWVESEGKEARNARDGFQHSVIEGILGTALAGLTHGKISLHIEPARPSARLPSLKDYYHGIIPEDEIKKIQKDCAQNGLAAHSAYMDRVGWPEIPLDGKLLVSHQDALLLGGKVQAPAGYADHIVFVRPDLCAECDSKICAEICSGQAITPTANDLAIFDREKCIHCGACIWSCAIANPDKPERSILELRAGAGGLHSAEN